MPMTSTCASGNTFTEKYEGPVIEAVVWMLHTEDILGLEDNFSGPPNGTVTV